MMRRFLLIACVLATPMASAAQPVQAQAQSAALEKMLQGEDQRNAATIREAMQDGLQRRRGIRALGRLEQPDLIRFVAPALNDGVGVRAEAASALAQLARTPEAAAQVQRLLIERAEADAQLGTWESWGEIAAALGRVPYTTSEQVAETERVLQQGLPAPDSFAEVETSALIGAVRGLEALARINRKAGTLTPRTWDLLRWSATAQRPPTDPRSSWTRRVAMAALIAGGQAGPVVERALADADVEVRRLGAQALGGDAPVDERERLFGRALTDSDPQVRWEALRAYGRQMQKTSCAPVLAALKDANPHVALQAIDMLAAGCPAAQSGAGELTALVETLGTEPRTWHRPSHALVALAKVAPDAATKALPRFARHQTWQVRMYAARTAGVLGDTATLVTLGRDNHNNVREAALAALVPLKHAEVVPLALEDLSRPDYQLVITAANALTGAPAARAVPALVTSLGRITAEHKDTSRDPRLAILTRLQALGDASIAPQLEGYVKDFDVKIAETAAELLTRWTGSPRTAAPQPLPAPGVTVAAVEALRNRLLRVTMAGLGRFDIAFDLEAAPLTCLRIARRAGEGYYNGLTWHRVVPNFVIQGGSPGANEYMGDALYMRDEVGLHRRGTVGISTRGHDTGDAQLFVNLVDSPRLDHLFTVFGTVISGMDIVDAVLEGDVIEKIEVVAR